MSALTIRAFTSDRRCPPVRSETNAGPCRLPISPIGRWLGPARCFRQVSPPPRSLRDARLPTENPTSLPENLNFRPALPDPVDDAFVSPWRQVPPPRWPRDRVSFVPLQDSRDDKPSIHAPERYPDLTSTPEQRSALLPPIVLNQTNPISASGSFLLGGQMRALPQRNEPISGRSRPQNVPRNR